MNINTLHGAIQYLQECHGYSLEQIQALTNEKILSFAKSYFEININLNNLNNG